MSGTHKMDPVDAHAPTEQVDVSARKGLLAGLAAGGVLVAGALLFIGGTVHAAGNRLTHPEAAKNAAPVAVADEAEVGYCTPAFKQVLQRVLNACGLVGSEQRRGCQPADVKTFAQISDEDFNALFTPLKDRGAIVMFDEGKDELDQQAKDILEKKWLDRKGARYFFVVARASKTGTPDQNRALSHKRANSVMFFLKDQTKDPDLDKQVGLLWLGSEFAQLGKDFCTWSASRPTEKAGKCDEEAINRSAFVSWVDCRL
jgi:outer membrane protein OmpA-like peptidoglycan-associated protein